METMNGMTRDEAREAWFSALESGNYKQGTGFLKRADGSYCCLGVLMEVLGIPSDQKTPSRHYVFSMDSKCAELPTQVVNFIGLYGEQGESPNTCLCSLSWWNDHHNRSFGEIAALLRKDLTNRTFNYLKE